MKEVKSPTRSLRLLSEQVHQARWAPSPSATVHLLYNYLVSLYDLHYSSVSLEHFLAPIGVVIIEYKEWITRSRTCPSGNTPICEWNRVSTVAHESCLIELRPRSHVPNQRPRGKKGLGHKVRCPRGLRLAVEQPTRPQTPTLATHWPPCPLRLSLAQPDNIGFGQKCILTVSTFRPHPYERGHLCTCW